MNTINQTPTINPKHAITQRITAIAHRIALLIKSK